MLLRPLREALAWMICPEALNDYALLRIHQEHQLLLDGVYGQLYELTMEVRNLGSVSRETAAQREGWLATARALFAAGDAGEGKTDE